MGYAYRIEADNALIQLLSRIKQRKIDNEDAIIKKIQNAGLYIDCEAMECRLDGQAPMVSTYSYMVLNDPRNISHPIIQPYREGGPRGIKGSLNFAIDYFLYGKPFYVPELQVSLVEGIKAISESGGVAVMAHPGVWMKPEHTKLLPELIDCGMLGMEVETPYHNDKQRKYFAELSKAYGLYQTHGSDYHGFSVKPQNHLGIFERVRK